MERKKRTKKSLVSRCKGSFLAILRVTGGNRTFRWILQHCRSLNVGLPWALCLIPVGFFVQMRGNVPANPRGCGGKCDGFLSVLRLPALQAVVPHVPQGVTVGTWRDEGADGMFRSFTAVHGIFSLFFFFFFFCRRNIFLSFSFSLFIYMDVFVLLISKGLCENTCFSVCFGRFCDVFLTCFWLFLAVFRLFFARFPSKNACFSLKIACFSSFFVRFLPFFVYFPLFFDGFSSFFTEFLSETDGFSLFFVCFLLFFTSVLLFFASIPLFFRLVLFPLCGLSAVSLQVASSLFVSLSHSGFRGMMYPFSISTPLPDMSLTGVYCQSKTGGVSEVLQYSVEKTLTLLACLIKKYDICSHD